MVKKAIKSNPKPINAGNGLRDADPVGLGRGAGGGGAGGGGDGGGVLPTDRRSTSKGPTFGALLPPWYFMFPNPPSFHTCLHLNVLELFASRLWNPGIDEYDSFLRKTHS